MSSVPNTVTSVGEIPAGANSGLAIAVGVVAYENRVDELTELAHSLAAAIAFARTAMRAEPFSSSLETNVVVYNNGAPESDLGALGDMAQTFGDGDNHGFGTANNTLMRKAFDGGADFYVGVNPDGLLHPRTLFEMLSMATRFRGEALIEASIFPSENPKLFDPLTFDTPWISGACFAISRRIFEKIGGFDESMFLYCEDVDLSWRARLAGFKTKSCPRALFFHSGIHRWKNGVIRREMLLSARYTAAKWGNRKFKRHVEGILAKGGVGPLPKIPPTSFRSHSGISDFDHELSFAPHRWTFDAATLDRRRRHSVRPAETVDVLVRFHDISQTDRLGRCLFSLYCQTHPKVQPILLLQRFAPEDVAKVERIVDEFRWSDRLRPIVCNVETDRPGDLRSHLINIGISRSTGRYLAILDYDDLVYQYTYEYLIDRLIADEAAIASGSVLMVQVTPIRNFDYVINKTRFGSGVDRFDMFCQNFCPPPSFLLDRSRIDKADLYFDESMSRHEDYHFLLRILAKYPSSFSAVGTTLGEYHLRTDGSNTVAAYDPDAAKLSEWRRHDKVLAGAKDNLTVTMTVAEIQSAMLRMRSAITQAGVDEREAVRSSFVNSSCWRLTAPLRFIMGAFHGFGPE